MAAPWPDVTRPTGDYQSVVRPEWFGAVGDGITDDSDAIQRAERYLATGGDIVFASGRTYMKRKLFTVSRGRVRLWGYGAVIYSYVSPAQVAGPNGSMPIAINLASRESGIYGFTLYTNLRVRRGGHPFHAGIWLSGPNQQAIDNRVEYAQNAVFVRFASNYAVARNIAYRTVADGFHQTTGSTDGTIVCNLVRENGDDGVAVVNYGLAAPPSVRRFLIADNDIADQYHGRGITVGGGADVTIRNNLIVRNPHNAGIYIVSERFYQTASVENVLVEDNDIRDIQVTRPPYNPVPSNVRTGQPGIDIAAEVGEQKVLGVIVRNNRIHNTFKDGIRVRGAGTVCDIGMQGNQMTRIQQSGIAVTLTPPPGCNIACNGNLLDGTERNSSVCEGNALPTTVTGRSS